ncbi:MAG: hypothetical protein ACRDT4_13830 [Micromonosporaceae bacterium]
MHPGQPAALAAQPPGRHPADPDPVRATKARAVLALGIVALCTAVTIGGVIPAVVALLLARQSRAEMRAANGFLTGYKLLRTGERLAWAAILIVVTVLVLAAITGIMRLAPGAG